MLSLSFSCVEGLHVCLFLRVQDYMQTRLQGRRRGGQTGMCDGFERKESEDTISPPTVHRFPLMGFWASNPITGTCVLPIFSYCTLPRALCAGERSSLSVVHLLESIRKQRTPQGCMA